jgi:hypothetical protein
LGAHLAKDVHRTCFQPDHNAFAPHAMWSFSNALTSSLKTLEPLSFYRATARVGPFFIPTDLSRKENLPSLAQPTNAFT